MTDTELLKRSSVECLESWFADLHWQSQWHPARKAPLPAWMRAAIR